MFYPHLMIFKDFVLKGRRLPAHASLCGANGNTVHISYVLTYFSQRASRQEQHGAGRHGKNLRTLLRK